MGQDLRTSLYLLWLGMALSWEGSLSATEPDELRRSTLLEQRRSEFAAQAAAFENHAECTSDTAGTPWQDCVERLFELGKLAISVDQQTAARELLFRAYMLAPSGRVQPRTLLQIAAHWQLASMLEEEFTYHAAREAQRDVIFGREYLWDGEGVPPRSHQLLAFVELRYVWFKAFQDGMRHAVADPPLIEEWGTSESVRTELAAWNALASVYERGPEQAIARMEEIASDCIALQFGGEHCLTLATKGLFLSILIVDRNLLEAWHSRVEQALSRSDRVDRSIIEVWGLLGRSALLQGRAFEAERYLLAAIDYSRNFSPRVLERYSEVPSSYAEALLESGDFNGALKAALDSISFEGFLDAHTMYVLAASYFRLGRLEEAFGELGTYGFSDCDNSFWNMKSCLLSAQLLIATDRFEEAAEVLRNYDRALDFVPISRRMEIERRMLAARMLYAGGQFDDAFGLAVEMLASMEEQRIGTPAELLENAVFVTQAEAAINGCASQAYRRSRTILAEIQRRLAARIEFDGSAQGDLKRFRPAFLLHVRLSEHLARRASAAGTGGCR